MFYPELVQTMQSVNSTCEIDIDRNAVNHIVMFWTIFTQDTNHLSQFVMASSQGVYMTCQVPLYARVFKRRFLCQIGISVDVLNWQ